jgi:hypothetical protein
MDLGFRLPLPDIAVQRVTALIGAMARPAVCEHMYAWRGVVYLVYARDKQLELGLVSRIFPYAHEPASRVDP